MGDEKGKVLNFKQQPQKEGVIAVKTLRSSMSLKEIEDIKKELDELEEEVRGK